MVPASCNQGGWLGIDWPKEYGGRGATILQTIVYHQELSRTRRTAALHRLRASRWSVRP